MNRKLKLYRNQHRMATLSSAAPRIKSAVAKDKVFFNSMIAARSSISSDDYALNKQSKIALLNHNISVIRQDVPQFKQQAKSNSVEYQQLSEANNDLDGTNASFGAALASPDTSSEDNNFNRATQSKLFK